MNREQPTEDTSATPTIPEMSASELRLERERCALELERLGLERERLETERLRLQRERDLYEAGGSNALRVGLWVLALAAVVALSLGLLFGYTAGADAGRSEVPPPRKVVVGREFIEALRIGRVGSLPGTAPGPAGARSPWFTLYSRPAADASAGNLPIVR